MKQATTISTATTTAVIITVSSKFSTAAAVGPARLSFVRRMLTRMDHSVILFTLKPVVGEIVLLRLHCGCIMAFHTHTILDFGGVKCAECAINEALATHRCQPTFLSPKAMLHKKDSPERPLTISEKAITGTKSGAGPTPSHDSTPTNPGAVPQAQFLIEKTREESSVISLDETNKSHNKIGGKRRRYSPEINYEEISEICAMSKSCITLLFAKELTASDADIKNGRLVLPKRCAEAYFPTLSGHQGISIVVQDTKGNDWELYYRYWSNTNGKMYVLEGLKDYIILNQWQAGDTDTSVAPDLV
ncbi:hypothetical protein PTKIN_Ptkin11bG0158400 [Pterospermum kingtungense]